MPVCFQLINKATNKAEKLQIIDDKIAAHFGQEPDTHTWFQDWYNRFGISLAMGFGWQEIRNRWRDSEYSDSINKITEYLEANYTVYSWRE